MEVRQVEWRREHFKQHVFEGLEFREFMRQEMKVGDVAQWVYHYI